MLNEMIVLDFTKGYCGAFTAMTLANEGAKVHKIQFEYDRDFLNDLGMKTDNGSSRFESYNHNKELLTVDLSNDEQKQILHSLMKSADVIIVNESSKNEILSYFAIREYNSSVIFANISNFGEAEMKLKYPESGRLAASLAGIVDMTGFTKETPVFPCANVIENFCGISLSVAITVAYYNKLLNNIGEYIDFSLYNTVFSIMESPIIFKTLLGQSSVRCGNGDLATLVPYDVFKCSDGYFSAGLAGDAGWDRFCQAIEMPELENDERFKNNEIRCKNYAVITPIISKFFIKKTREELTEIFTNKNIPNSPVLSIGETMEIQQIKDRKMVIETEHGLFRVGNPIKY